MSRYLIDRINSLDNLTILVHSEVVKLQGDRGGALASATIREKKSGRLVELPVRHVFLFVGAEPNTQWLDGYRGPRPKGLYSDGDAGTSVATGGPASSANERPWCICDRRCPFGLHEARRVCRRRGRGRRGPDSFDAERGNHHGVAASGRPARRDRLVPERVGKSDS
jgi:hypothetical protein